MTSPERELPEWVKSRLGPPNTRNDLTKHAVARELCHGKRPYYSVAQMRAALGQVHSKDTVRSRLDELVELDVGDTDQVNNGTIYFLNHEDSEWPIPPDVDVEPTRTEQTVSEFFSQLHVQFAALGVTVSIGVEGILILGLYKSSNSVPFPLSATELFVSGFTGIVVAWVFFALAGVVWAFDFDNVEWFD